MSYAPGQYMARPEFVNEQGRRNRARQAAELARNPPPPPPPPQLVSTKERLRLADKLIQLYEDLIKLWSELYEPSTERKDEIDYFNEQIDHIKTFRGWWEKHEKDGLVEDVKHKWVDDFVDRSHASPASPAKQEKLVAKT